MCSLYVAISKFLFKHSRQRFVCGLHGIYILTIVDLTFAWRPESWNVERPGNIEKYWLKTLHSPKQVKEISAFEKDLITGVKSTRFKNARGDFQTTLQDDIRLIHNTKKTMTFGDKTSNLYWRTKDY